MGNLKEIIIGLKKDFDNTRIVPRFATKRIKCGRQCMKNERCQMCNRIIELSKTLSETPIIIKTEKEDERWQEDQLQNQK